VLVTPEVVLGGVPNLLSRTNLSEVVQGGVPVIRSRFNAVEELQGGTPVLRSRLLVVETLQKVLEEHMSDVVFPGIDPATGLTAVLRGLAFDVHKKPIFSNKIVTHTSGKETATSYYENPKWEYTLTYDYLPDIPKSVGETDLRMIMGFFLNRRGRFDTFLFDDPDDNTVVEGFQKDFDGSAVEFNLVRGIMGFYEPVGQLNLDQPYSVWLNVTETNPIPDTPGPYTVTVTQAAAWVSTELVTINGVTATEVAGPPAAGQYSVAAGVYTFNVADRTKTAVIRYRYLVDPADYTLSMPNLIVFDTAPPDLATAYASFQFYFVCRFIDDVSDYRKFMDKLWDLNELGFRSIPQ
jgi:hypothetical protein